MQICMATCNSGLGGFWVFRVPGSDFSMLGGLLAQFDSGSGRFWVFRGPGSYFFMEGEF